MSKPPHTVAIIDRDPRIICAAANVLSALGLRQQLYHSIEAFFADPRASLIGCLIVDFKIAHAETSIWHADSANPAADHGSSSPERGPRGWISGNSCKSDVSLSCASRS